MPSLFFPNPDALRLALASGIVPPEVAREPVRAGSDDAGRPWVSVPPGFPKDALAALARIGVTLHGPGTGPPARPLSRWPELLPLRPHPGPAAGPVLFDLPDRRLAAVAAEVRRTRPQPLAVRFLPAGRAWLTLPDPPAFTVLGAADAEAFVEQAPRVWVLAGWRHPLDALLSAAPGTVALLRPGRDWEIVPDDAAHPVADAFALPPQPTRPRPHAPRPPPRLPVRLALRPTAQAAPGESLWVLAGDAAARLVELAKDTDERVLRRFRAAVVRADGPPRLLVRAAGRGATPVLVPDGRGFAAHPGLPTLFVPTGFRLTPAVRPAALARLLGADPATVCWMEPAADGSVAVGRAPADAFKPLADLVGYEVPPAAALAPFAAPADPFRLPRFALEPDPLVAPDGPLPEPEFPPPDEAREGWLGRSLHKLAGTLLGKAAPPKAKPKRPPRAKKVAEPAAEPAGRLGGKLSSPDILLLGNEWAARRSALEQRVLVELPRLPPTDRAAVWHELAEVYAAVGNPADAAVCHLSAAWDADPPPVGWVVGWLRCEARAAKVPRDGTDAAALLDAPPSAPTARVAAAHLAWAAAVPTPPPDALAALPKLLARVDAFEAELPARAVWLARLAAARLTDGDALGLARCRDRVFARLVDTGPGLDLDAPSFLRFRNGAAGDRFQTARDWLVRVRDAVHRWLARAAPPGRLQWAGLDPELGCTAAYADLMLAWGLSKLGDRAKAKDLEAHAGGVLDRAGGAGVDPAVHRVLRAGFADRLRAAQDGRPDRPGLPLEAAAELARLDDLGRYAVDRLRAASGVLEPVDLVNPFRGRDLGPFLGGDPLGERLSRLLARPDLAPDPADVRGLLALADADPTAAILPRVVFALLAVAPRLDPASVAALVPKAGAAIELLPEWVRVGMPARAPNGEVGRFAARLLASACHAAGLFHLPDSFRRAADAVAAGCETPGSAPAAAVGKVAGRFFRTLRRLGLTGHAADVLQRLTPAADAPPRPVTAADLGLAVGWFAVGNDDAGMGLLNAAQERLFVTGVADERDRTALAIGYAAALGHARPRIALGRLEELFLRLDAVTGHGAANRYFTAKPLELVDTVVRAVVSDDFCVGPGVRGWLDDDEYLIRRRVTRDLEAAL